LGYETLEVGEIIHLSALLSGDAAKDVEQSPIAEHQSCWRDEDGRFRVRATVPFSRELLRRLLGYGSDVRVDQPEQLRNVIVQTLCVTSAAYVAHDDMPGVSSLDSAQVTMRYFDDWQSVRLTCAVCSWHGSADPSTLRWNDSDRYPVKTFRCPLCGKALLAIEHSASMTDTLANLDKLRPDQRVDALDSAKRFSDIEASRLKGPDQLPDLKPENDSSKLVWDIEQDGEGTPWNVIRHGDRILWRQRATWEGFDEFSRIAEIIHRRYGNAIRDLEPTKKASMWLGGDALWSDEVIEKARRRLGWRRLP
jgi:hypothetical protein